MITLSLCMIVKNEEDVLARCLSCIKDIADEIIIIDTGSTDRTKEIAATFTNHVYDFPWCDDFAKARNFSFSMATMDYIMWLDADDIITETDQQLLLALKQRITFDIDIVMMKYHVAFDEQEHPTFSYYRERIFRQARNYQWIGEIHEIIPLVGNIIYEEVAVCHKKLKANVPERNLKIFENMLERGETLEPRKQYYYARELYYNQKYDSAIAIFHDFLEGRKGWIENNIGACQDLAACYYRKELPDKALEILFKSFIFDKPRAEICCDVGKHFFDREQYKLAAYWYETALSCEMDAKSGGFCQPDCYNYIPFIQLCVCYDRMDDLMRANDYNEKAGHVKPNDKSYLYNKVYFGSKISVISA